MGASWRRVLRQRRPHARRRGAVGTRSADGSDCADVRGLRALSALRDIELDPLVLVEAAEAVRGDSREVGEHVRATAVRCDEPVALVRVEPLHSTDSHIFSLESWIRGPAPCGPRRRGVDRPRPEMTGKHRAPRGSDTHQALAKYSETTTATGPPYHARTGRPTGEVQIPRPPGRVNGGRGAGPGFPPICRTGWRGEAPALVGRAMS